MAKSKSPTQARKARTPKAEPAAKPVALALPQPLIPTLPQTPPPILNKQQMINLLLARLTQQREQEIADYNAHQPLIEANAWQAFERLMVANGYENLLNDLPPGDITAIDCCPTNDSKSLQLTITLPIDRTTAELIRQAKYNRAPRPLADWEIADARRKFAKNILAQEVAKIRTHLDNPAVCKALDSIINDAAK